MKFLGRSASRASRVGERKQRGVKLPAHQVEKQMWSANCGATSRPWYRAANVTVCSLMVFGVPGISMHLSCIDTRV